jgi:hypothetical protein
MKHSELAALIVAALALASAIGAGYVSVATRTTPLEVEHIVELHTLDKFAEMQRRFDTVDRNTNRILDKLDRLEQKGYDKPGS